MVMGFMFSPMRSTTWNFVSVETSTKESHLLPKALERVNVQFHSLTCADHHPRKETCSVFFAFGCPTSPKWYSRFDRARLALQCAMGINECFGGSTAVGVSCSKGFAIVDRDSPGSLSLRDYVIIFDVTFNNDL
jgi:hypothetical protein